MARVALTGSEGFIGTALQDFWARSQFPVPALTLDKEGAALYIGDLTQEQNWPDMSDCIAMVHLASRTSVVVPEGEEESVIDHNAMLAFNAVHQCAEYGIPLLINASSSSVYGSAPTPFEETLETKPLGAYGQSKLEAEHVLEEHAARLGVRVVSLRLFNAIGMYQRRSMLPWLIMEARHYNKAIPLYGHSLRAWTSVTDICKVISFIIAQGKSIPVGHSVYNYGCTASLTQLELFRMFERFLPGSTIPYEMKAARSFEMRATRPDMGKFRMYFPQGVWPSEMNVPHAVKDVIYTYAKATGLTL